MSIGISVIICCYNSSNRLPKTIEHLANQKIPASTSWELIIVDNNSTDNTDEVAAMEWSKYDCTGKFNIVKEENIGLSHARFRGVSHASFEYILFCDDDNWLQEDYIRKAINIIDSKPEIGVLGGQGIVKADTALPDWWEDFASSYAVGKQNETSGIVDERGYLWGAGMVTKKKLYLDAYNGFPSL
ncbi:MAG TPA: glycosyltransferase family A protein, partial [Saprospiraceae bacterium]|nr:glycosyltransferase family A protein [Saprospiraceae bacterium]